MKILPDFHIRENMPPRYDYLSLIFVCLICLLVRLSSIPLQPLSLSLRQHCSLPMLIQKCYLNNLISFRNPDTNKQPSIVKEQRSTDENCKNHKCNSEVK